MLLDLKKYNKCKILVVIIKFLERIEFPDAILVLIKNKEKITINLSTKQVKIDKATTKKY